ncbi:anti-sigma factor [Conexibacter woesei]|uniref:Regulator of SigK n=1 Tax=Conexibacter woesei (strain DSM 14684 / CCUG 47730 / CIP 108061 / JCM 11494 / NBRC 100937 / ID131577) TaxID=469383 RepID=D3EZX2_CONWI|nr:anti-sigma factor [Conexibacter woesei]ADB49948.1 anti-ECFsigma factor, ChrR [Conexibacter woesei DSM 14684]
MKPADGHSRWEEDLAAYAIGALDPRDTVAFAAHLAECDRCRGELHRLAPAVELLPASVEQVDPPPALRGRIMAAIAAEPHAARSVDAASPPPHRRRTDRQPPPPPRRSWRERIRGWHVPALPAAATAAALAAAFAIGFAVRGGGDGGSQPQRTTVPVASLAPGADVRAQLVSSGGSWQLDVGRMPALPPGRVYQAWVMRRGRDVEPSTVFVLARNGSGTVAIPQSLGAGDQVLVTREPRGGSDRPTSAPLLQASV